MENITQIKEFVNQSLKSFFILVKGYKDGYINKDIYNISLKQVNEQITKGIDGNKISG